MASYRISDTKCFKFASTNIVTIKVMGKVLILDEKEKKDLLSQIDSLDTYNDVMALLDTIIKQRNNCPYTLDKNRQIAKNSITEYKSGLGTSIKEMRNIF